MIWLGLLIGTMIGFSAGWMAGALFTDAKWEDKLSEQEKK